MVTRFQSKTLPVYHAPQYQSPLASIWSAIAAWYSTSPEFRQKFAEIFASDGTPTEEQLAEASEAGTAGMEGYVPAQVLDESGTELITNPSFMGRDSEGTTKGAKATRQAKLFEAMPALESGSWLDDKLAYDAANDMSGYATGWMSGYNPNLRGGHR